ncbi:acyl-CoA N-acyltransferase [Microthyrium microscopicum]|uniref:Acyl-CoA N-acyltransferase n=1 Tax=Microthyrium microscopicum TaxID=703497 RepID=A0A6A6U902_9PEZI|nr:acyl-CoA N-acyltransferase [Microthyrium microscopicum]
MLPHPPITVRKATILDLPTIATVLTTAFWDEDSVGRFLHPLRALYPADVRRFWKRRMLASLLHHAHQVLVAVDEHGQIIGVADWQRKGPGANTSMGGWKRTLRFPLTWLVTLVNWLDLRMRPNRAGDPAHVDAFPRAFARFEHFWSGERADLWMLESLGVDPSHQGRGVGTALVEEGLKVATRDGVVASVVSSAGNEKFYVKRGFTVRLGNVTEGEGNPLAGVMGGDVFFTPGGMDAVE